MGEAPTGSAAQAAFFGSLFSLKGRTALVTGSSRGIGHAIALGLAQAGATVILHGTRDSEPLREAAQARLADKEASLKELAERLGVTKSCLNHRLRKLVKIADELNGD